MMPDFRCFRMPECFLPWIDEQTRVLVVGTMPSVASLQAEMYYAHPQNRFWSYMAQILNDGMPVMSAAERKSLLLKNHIGLWDSLAHCERQGSLDSAIMNAVPNDFSRFKQIKYYLFNGQKAYQFFKKYNGALLMLQNYAVLPSTSPANASIKNDVKFAYWLEAVKKSLRA